MRSLPLVLLGALWLLTIFSVSAQADDEGPQAFRPDWAPFLHGVASGDPHPDGVLLWTRYTPERDELQEVEIDWRVALDPEFENVVQSGAVRTGVERDFTVKVAVRGLQSNTTYYYGFSADERHSLTGRTKTAPLGTQAQHLRFGLVSCVQYQRGFFNALQALALRTDLDGIIVLGDYIYEQAIFPMNDTGRAEAVLPKNKLVSLDDYRQRYASYRLDTNLIRAQQQHPILAVWDDHEFADNAYQAGAGSHNPEQDGPWEVRKAHALQAYFEWMPVPDPGPEPVIYRRLAYGDLLDLFLLDTRLIGRDRQIYDPFDPDLDDPGRSILGDQQRQWLLGQLESSVARWKVIGQQVPFSPLELGWASAIDQDELTSYGQTQGLTQDGWNGYPAERQQIIQFLRDRSISDVVVLSGSYHVSFAFDVTDRPVEVEFRELSQGITPFYSPSPSYEAETGEGSVAVEFVAPSVTSRNFDENFDPLLAKLLQGSMNKDINLPGLSIGNPNPHLKYADLIQHGYVLLDLKPGAAQADWYFHEVEQPEQRERYGQSWYTTAGENRLRQAALPSFDKPDPPLPAPPEPPLAVSTRSLPTGPLTDLELYPNPSRGQGVLQFTLLDPAWTQVMLLDGQGRPIRLLFEGRLPAAAHTLPFAIGSLPAGTYLIQVVANGRALGTRAVFTP